jgi:hypothetical protein
MRDTIDMAREAGAIHIHESPKEFAIVGNDSIKTFEALVRADEREACAKVCEDDALSSQYGERSKYRALLATTIRARGNT